MAKGKQRGAAKGSMPSLKASEIFGGAAGEGVRVLYYAVVVGTIIGACVRWVLYDDLPFFLVPGFWN